MTSGPYPADDGVCARIVTRTMAPQRRVATDASATRGRGNSEALDRSDVASNSCARCESSLAGVEHAASGAWRSRFGSAGARQLIWRRLSRLVRVARWREHVHRNGGAGDLVR
jgi:hypothetical protein